MWDMQLKATNKRTKQTKTHRHRQQFGGYQREMGVGEEEEGSKRQKTETLMQPEKPSMQR